MIRTIRHRAGLGSTASVIQGRRLLSSQISVDAPTLVAVKRGTKRLRWLDREETLQQGEFVALAAGQTFDVINSPCEQTNVYEAEWLVCESDVVTAHLQQRPTGTAINDVLSIRGGELLRSSFEHACEGIRNEAVPLPVARVRLMEMLSWVGYHGGYFDNGARARVALQVRQLVGTDLGSDWTAMVVAKHLGMSEATLRRRLSDEATTFQRLLTDVRMSHALTLLQVTDKSVLQIAYEVGYNSSSRFASRFRQRFGYNPSDVRSA